MISLITKEQIGKYMSLTENIGGLDVEEYISDVNEFDLEVFPDALINAIRLNVADKIQQWNKNKTYAIGDKVWFETESDGKYFVATAINTNSQPLTDNWEPLELMNFYASYLVPFMAYSFQYRFTAYHGMKTAQAGLIQATDPNGTFQPISEAARGRKLGDIKSKVTVWTGKISKKLNDVNYTFDGVKYTPESGKSTHVRSRPRLWAVGGNNNNCYPKRNCPPYFERYD